MSGTRLATAGKHCVYGPISYQPRKSLDRPTSQSILAVGVLGSLTPRSHVVGVQRRLPHAAGTLTERCRPVVIAVKSLV